MQASLASLDGGPRAPAKARTNLVADDDIKPGKLV